MPEHSWEVLSKKLGMFYNPTIYCAYVTNFDNGLYQPAAQLCMNVGTIDFQTIFSVIQIQFRSQQIISLLFR